MIRHEYRVAGEKVTINVLEHLEDLEPLRAWFSTHGRDIIACDTEGTGLNPYAPDFQLRLVQFGDGKTAWVVPYDRFSRAIQAILRHPAYRFVWCNIGYDAEVLHALGVVDGNELAARSEDTQILSHLVDPRPAKEGGVGLGLKPNTAAYVDSDAPDTQSGLHKVFGGLVLDNTGSIHEVSGLDTKARAKLRKGLRESGLAPRTLKVDEGWRHIPLYHPIYTLYAGLDVIYAHRLHEKLSQKVRLQGTTKLAEFEHAVLRDGVMLKIRGLQTDREYLTNLSDEFLAEIRSWEEEAAKYGVTKVGSTAQLVDAFVGMGEKLRAKTDSGAFKVDQNVLYRLADLSTENHGRMNKREPNPLAEAVLHVKRASKWRSTYAEGMLKLADSNGRVHPALRTLQARTARMSAGIFQQLPSSDWKVRTGVVGTNGNHVGACDYDQIEMRVAGAMSGEPKMIDAARRGISQHVITARTIYGEGFDKDTMLREYDIAKMAGFLSVYGGGAPTLELQSGLPLEKCREIFKMYREGLPRLSQWKKEIGQQVMEDALDASDLKRHRKCITLMFDAETDEDRLFWKREAASICKGKLAYIKTPIGRVLPVEAEFSYRVSNYYVQSTARDILAQALRRLVDSSLNPGLLLPIHDEVLVEAPESEMEDYLREMEKVMAVEFMGVPIPAGGVHHGHAWGDGKKYHR